MRGEVVNAGTTAGRLYMFARDVDDLMTTIEATNPSAVVLDREYGDADEVLRRMATLPVRDQTLIVLVFRDALQEPPAGAHVLVLEPALRQALAMVDRPVAIDDRRPIGLDRLLTVSVLSGVLDEALAKAADELAAGFGVDRCLIAVRGDSTGGVGVGAHTWDSLTWSQTAERCRAAATSAATLIALAPSKGAPCESYLAVPLQTPLGNHGFLGLVASRPRIFPRQDRIALQAVASRLGAELGWRSVHERTAADLDRSMNGPSLEPMLGIWNRPAMIQLGAMWVSAAGRSKLPLSAVVIDVVGLAGINTRHGHDIGDRVLRRIADALRATVRTEDVVGRWAGDKFAVVLQATTPDGAQRVAERLQSALSVRPIELANGATLPVPVTVGIAALQSNEDISRLLARAAWETKKAEGPGIVIARSTAGPSRAVSQQLDVIGDEMRATLGGTYRLLHEISRGGMGVVYRAEDLALERPVAIKMLRPDLAVDEAFVEHLRGEAAMLARLQHPNLVQIYNFGQDGGDAYFVMELVEGEGMQQAVDRHCIEGTTMPITEIVAVIDQVASALDALHDRGIVHRDVKPGNIIRDPFRSRAVLVDVGIARRYGQFVESAGTPGYVAPEVIEGNEASPRSDVYGLAATAYTLITLGSPWGDGEIANLVALQCSDVPLRPPSAVYPQLQPLDSLMLRALGRDPAQRPASASAFARAFATALSVLAPAPKSEPSRWVGNTVMPSRAPAVAKTRGVVFRSVARAIGIRDTERLRDAIGVEHPELARALTDTAPLGWLPTELLVKLVEIAPEHVGRDRAKLARDIARATVRASFRRFFPASIATLVPERTLSAIRNVWSRYQSWGNVSSMPVHQNEMVVRISDTPREPELCVWACGMLETLVTLSGGRGPNI
ncbi:MAG TPA: diguanylate cyclase, partial [Kofleriaceae bacterium]|nr:diguanylate cyclase [Kofleriaceae bacterium]